MQDKRVLSSYNRFAKALQTLQEVVQDQNVNNPYLQDAIVKRFEYTYEAAWKAVKFILEEKGVFEIHPSDIFREAFAAGWILDAELFRQMIASRNMTSHQYSEIKAEEICNQIRETYYTELKYLQIQLGGVVYGHS